MTRPFARMALLTTTAAVVACGQRGAPGVRDGDSLSIRLQPRLPTGVRLDPAAPLADVGPMPLTMRAAPEGDRVVLLLSGYREQGLQVVDAASGRVVQRVPQASAFVGLAFSPDQRTLYASGGNQDVVYRYDWRNGAAALRDSLVLARKQPRRPGTRYPAGIAVSRNGKALYVAENIADSLAVIDVATGTVMQRFATDKYPYDVLVMPDGMVCVSAWGGNTVSFFAPDESGTGRVFDHGKLTVARHPSALAANADGTRLFVASGSTDHVAVVQAIPKGGRRVIARLLDPPPAGPGEGATPNALSLSRDGTRLFVAEADANAVAVFDLSAATSDVPSATGTDQLSGRIPAGWYPTAVLPVGDALVVASGKGRGTAANREGPNPGRAVENSGDPRTAQYTLNTLSGAVMRVPLTDAQGDALVRYTARVAAANGWTGAPVRNRYPPIEHVLYIIKENRTYDQVFGDLRQADGDTSLMYFSRDVSPNHHALAERFGIYDRFFVNAEVSPDGHNWSTAAYATDYLEKTVPSNYSARGRTYDYEGTNRGFGTAHVPDDDVAEPAGGYLWNLAQKKGITYRNYGEFAQNVDPTHPVPNAYYGTKPFLYAHTNTSYPSFDLTIRDQRRADIWIAELQQYVAQGSMPALETMRLPNDHTSGGDAGRPSPRAAFADNDLALGRIIEALSKTPFWRTTAVFVLEDDAQNGPDHVDSHRSPMLVISPYARPGVHHRFANTTDVLRTIEEILGLESMSHFDYFGRPLRDIWTDAPDVRPYTALVPAQSLDQMNPRGTRDARESATLDLHVEDAADEELFNRILWRMLKGNAPYPGASRAAALEIMRSANP